MGQLKARIRAEVFNALDDQVCRCILSKEPGDEAHSQTQEERVRSLVMRLIPRPKRRGSYHRFIQGAW